MTLKKMNGWKIKEDIEEESRENKLGLFKF